MVRTLERQDFHYIPYYCEENVWFLCQESLFSERKRKVVFILSPENRAVPFWGQRASSSPERPERPVYWDYHVVLFCFQNSWTVWDLDTLIGFPVTTQEYLEKTFPSSEALPICHQPLFRVIDGEEFIETFSSDRSHMLTSSGEWLAPPPPWPPIRRGSIVTFDRFVKLNSDWVGEILTLDEMKTRFG